MIAMLGLLARLTGGRPMMWLGHAFTDQVSGKPVFYFKDRLGRFWLAESSWSRFRVPSSYAEMFLAKEVHHV